MLLLGELGAGGDRALLAHVLLAPLAADLVWHLREDEGVDADALDRRAARGRLP